MMAPEPRLVNANAIKYREKDEYCGNGNSRPVRYVTKEDVGELPTVDAVEVVRCYQCKHSDVCEDGTIFCKLHSELGEREERGNAYSVWMEPDDFCSYGERKSDDE